MPFKLPVAGEQRSRSWIREDGKRQYQTLTRNAANTAWIVAVGINHQQVEEWARADLAKVQSDLQTKSGDA